MVVWEEKGVAFRAKNQMDIYNICKKLLSSPTQLKEISQKASALNRNSPLAKIDKIIQLKKILAEQDLFEN